ncbi:MAG: class I SAM-dependent methyltransferase [Erysipelotrichaceae bacterium]|jgi:23S rRNA (cytosine1962-C5)-methyltransferase|nr:class I SAM-dependent methyltransferase [Erysipelotrichaceae bacterium]
MITSNSFPDYTLLDAGDREKLENWKGYILRRPDPMAIWPKSRPELWEKADAYYHRSNSGGGHWEYKNRLPEAWNVSYRDLTFRVAPTGFKHTGLFPEQAANWDFIAEKLKGRNDAKVLNMFAYTGAATMVASAYGATEVVHLDASKSINEWAKDNMKLSGLSSNHIRFIVDDALKFTAREIRRGHKYDGIIMDPPSYGRGPDNELFKFEDKINPLIENALELLSDNPLFIIINTYTTGYSPTVIANALQRHLEEKKIKGVIESDEIGIRIENSSYTLPCGQTTRWHK